MSAWWHETIIWTNVDWNVQFHRQCTICLQKIPYKFRILTIPRYLTGNDVFIASLPCVWWPRWLQATCVETWQDTCHACYVRRFTAYSNISDTSIWWLRRRHFGDDILKCLSNGLPVNNQFWLSSVTSRTAFNDIWIKKKHTYNLSKYTWNFVWKEITLLLRPQCGKATLNNISMV